MNKKISIIVMTMIAVFTIVFTSYETNVIKTSKKNVKETEYSDFFTANIHIQKTDEFGNPLSGVVFKLKDANNTFNIEVPESSTPGIYRLYETSNPNFEQIIKVLPQEKQDLISNFSTREDVESSPLQKDCYENYCDVYENFPVILEETKAPSGYIKEKRILIGYLSLYYDFEGNEITYSGTDLYISTEAYLYEQDLINTKTFTEDLFSGKYDSLIKTTEPESRIELKRTDESTVQFDIDPVEANPLVIVNKKGTIDLSLQSYVNKKQNILTTNNKKIRYSLIIQNNGTATSTENIVKSNLPKGFEYVEGSASHLGEYNKKDHKVEWRIGELNAEETLELTYDAIIPNAADPKLEYIGTATINSREVPTEINAKETIVNLEEPETILKNPQTGNFINFIILAIVGIVGLGVYTTTYQNKIRPSIKLK